MGNKYLYHEVLGFDYKQAILELSHKMTYENICMELGYEYRSSIYKVLDGATPNHVIGEALYALYKDTFGKRPPLKEHQKVQFLISDST